MSTINERFGNLLIIEVLKEKLAEEIIKNIDGTDRDKVREFLSALMEEIILSAGFLSSQYIAEDGLPKNEKDLAWQNFKALYTFTSAMLITGKLNLKK